MSCIDKHKSPGLNRSEHVMKSPCSQSVPFPHRSLVTMVSRTGLSLYSLSLNLSI